MFPLRIAKRERSRRILANSKIFFLSRYQRHFDIIFYCKLNNCEIRLEISEDSWGLEDFVQHQRRSYLGWAANRQLSLTWKKRRLHRRRHHCPPRGANRRFKSRERSAATFRTSPVSTAKKTARRPFVSRPGGR